MARVKKTEEKKAGFTLDQLKELAERMNEVLDLDPPIDTEEFSDADDLKAKIIEEGTVYTTDEFTDDEWKLLTALGIEANEPPAEGDEPAEEPAEEPKPAKGKGKGKDKPAETKKKETGTKTTPTGFVGDKMKKRMAFIIPYIEKGKSTRGELMELLQKEYPDATKSALYTMLTDGKNVKYNRFPFLLVEDGEGKVSFDKKQPNAKYKS